MSGATTVTLTQGGKALRMSVMPEGDTKRGLLSNAMIPIDVAPASAAAAASAGFVIPHILILTIKEFS
jgi:hypothetical protein